MVGGVVHRLVRRVDRVLPDSVLLRVVLPSRYPQQPAELQQERPYDGVSERAGHAASVVRPVRAAVVREHMLREEPQRREERVRHLRGAGAHAGLVGGESAGR